MKASLIQIKFNPQWILSVMKDGQSTVVDEVLTILKEMCPKGVVVTVNREFHQCSVLIAGDAKIQSEELETLISNHINSSDAKLNVQVQELDKQQLVRLVVDHHLELSDEQRTFLEEKFGIYLREEARTTKEGRGEGQPKKSLPAELIGMQSCKDWLEELELLATKQGNLVKQSGILNKIAYLFSINRGNGLSTVIEMAANILKKHDMIAFHGACPVYEFNMPYCGPGEQFHALNAFLEGLQKRSTRESFFRGIVVMNIEEWVDHVEESKFSELLTLAAELQESILFVFRIPYLEDTAVQGVQRRLDDLFTTRTMRVAPPTNEQYFEFFKQQFPGYGIDVNPSAYAVFCEKLALEKSDGKFYGYNTIRKICDEVLYYMIASSAKQGTDLPAEIDDSLIAKAYSLKQEDAISGMEQLQSMVALKEVKEKVQEILATTKLQKSLYQQGKTMQKPCFHMMFTGNPGTGKTVVARIIGRIFKEEGLLSVGNFFEVSRQDLVGKYVGHTGPKTMELCRNAYGSVLFLDEAYLLAQNDGYSSEAVGTLIAAMENYRDDMIVIFAGYENELKELLSVNPGLKDRIPYTIHFPNYSRDELKEIFYLQLTKDIKCSVDFHEKVDEYFKNFPEELLSRREFSNGRYVRNMVERIISKAAIRCEIQQLPVDELELTAGDFELAVADGDFQTLSQKRRKHNAIGF